MSNTVLTEIWAYRTCIVAATPYIILSVNTMNLFGGVPLSILFVPTC